MWTGSDLLPHTAFVDGLNSTALMNSSSVASVNARIVRVLGERDDVAAADRLLDQEGLLGELIARLVPHQAAGDQPSFAA